MFHWLLLYLVCKLFIPSLISLRRVTSFDSVATTSSLSSDPSGGTVSAGDLYYNTTSNVLKFYNGNTNAWVNIEAVDTSGFSTKGFATAMAVAL